MLKDSGFGYEFIPGVEQYSGGVIARPGFEVCRVVLPKLPPVADGFGIIERFLLEAELPLTALCAVELRSPAPFNDVTFAAFNAIYLGHLRDWGILGEAGNPIARSNVCPVYLKPEVPALFAFSYVRPAPAASTAATFIVSGSAEVPEGMSNYTDHIVAKGDETPEGLAVKAAWVLAEMERRLGLLGQSWDSTTGVQMYTRREVAAVVGEQIAARGRAAAGLTWHFADPPIEGLLYEMDARGTAWETTR